MAKDDLIIGDPSYSRSRAEDCRQVARQIGMEAYARDLEALARDYECAALRLECASASGLEEAHRRLTRFEALLARHRHAVVQLDDGGEPTDIAEKALDDLEELLRAERMILTRAVQPTATAKESIG